MRKIIRQLVTLAACGCASTSALAEGPGASGGGNELVAKFVTLADALLNNYPFHASDAVLLRDALATSRIESTPVLRDPATGAPIDDQSHLVAWSSRGLIQLKEGQGADSFARLVREQRPVAQQIAHELFRSSGALGADGRSVDDTYQRSIGVYHLDRYVLLPADVAGQPVLTRVLELVGADVALKPNGRMLYCADILGEITLAETESDYVVVLRSKAYNGTVVGPMLRDVDPQFSADSRGGYLQLRAHIPQAVANACRFSPSAGTVLNCGLGARTGDLELSDGARTKALDDAQLYFATEQQQILRVDTPLIDQVVAKLTLYGNQHPFVQGGYNSETSFNTRACTSQ